MPTGPEGMATGCSASRTSGRRSRTSKIRSKLTSAVMMSTRTFDSDVSGPYIRVRSTDIATRVPVVSWPAMVMSPPSP